MLKTLLFCSLLWIGFFDICNGGTTGNSIRPPEEGRYKILIDILDGKYKRENEKNLPRPVQSAIRQVRRWRQAGLSLNVRKVHNIKSQKLEKQIFIDNKLLLSKNMLRDHTKKALKEAKGSGATKLAATLERTYEGISYKNILRELKTIPDAQANKPVFDNKAPLKPIRAEFVQQRHQVDLVSFNKMPVTKNGKTYKYVLAVMDVFSRYLWLRPLQNKRSKNVALYLKQIYESEGSPLILQCDNGKEFKGAVLALCYELCIKIILSRPYHPQSQGKIECSHSSWKKKIHYDIRKQTNTNWVESLQKYCRIRNEEKHDSLSMSPFEVYHGRVSNRFGHKELRQSVIGTNQSNISKHIEGQEKIRQKANMHSNYKADKIITKSLAKNPPSIYHIGEKVMVRKSNIGAVKRKRVTEIGTVVKRNLKLHTYKIRTENGELKWFRICDVAALCRKTDLKRRSRNFYFDRIKPTCSYAHETCFKRPSPGCSYNLHQNCCRKKLIGKCCIKTHNFLDITSFILEKKNCKVIDYLNYLSEIQVQYVKDQKDASDELVRNAMVYNLIPSSHDIPKDGNCLFHSVAIGVGELDNVQYRQEDIRMAVVAYLRSNPTLPNGEALADFVPNRNWEDYLDGLAGDEWGDHISIVAISNIYNVQINIVSSQDTRLQQILPYVSNMAQDRNIYLGHEFEVHYILLENLVSQDYQNDSVNSGNELISNTFFSVKNSSGDDASDFYDENESVNKQDACSHISIEKESDSENQADSNDNGESPDFNENNNISTDIENNSNDEKDDSGNIHCDVPMPEKRPKRKIIPPSRYSPCQLQNVAQRNKRNTRMLYTRASMFTLFTKLPREIQLKILFLLIGSSAACIGILNRVCTHFRQMIIGSINQLPKIYINSGTMTRLTNKVTNEMSTEFDGRIYEFSLRSLCMASGKSSGLMISIKDIFRGYTKWFSGYITVRSSDTPGWFYITDFYLKHDDDYFY